MPAASISSSVRITSSGSTSKRSGRGAAFSIRKTRSVRPVRAASRPHASSGASWRAWAMISSMCSGANCMPPERYLEASMVVGSSSSSRASPLSDSLNSRMPFPSERPTSGSFFGPSTMSAMARTRTSSMGPTFGIRPPTYRSYMNLRLPGSPPQRRLQRLDLLDRLGVDAARQVLPAVVGHDEHDVALVELARDAVRDARDGPRRDAGEHALLVEQLARPDDRVGVGDEDLAVQQRQ